MELTDEQEEYLDNVYLMKAMLFTEYGSPDLLELKEVEQPVPGDDEVLVKVHAS